MNDERGKVIRKILIAVMILFAAGVFIFGRLLIAGNNGQSQEAPWIEFASPESGDTLTGTEIVSASFEYLYDYNRTVYLYANGAVAGQVNVNVKKGSVTYSLDTTKYSDGPLQLMVSECPPVGGGDWCRKDTINVTVSNVVKDTEKPVISITDPSANEVLGAKPVLVAADLADNKAVDASSVVVKLDGTAVTSQCTVTAVSVRCSLSPAAEGAHSVTIDAKDTSGNAAVEKSVSFSLDTVAPNVAVTSHTNGQTVNTATINLAGTTSDATSGVASVEVNGTAATIANGNWTLNNFALSEGANVITVVAEDKAGHSKTVILTITYTIPDTQKPLINITEPTANELLGSKPVLVSADLSDNKAVDASSVVVKLDGSAITSQCTVTAVSVSCSLSPAAEGAHSVTIDAKDTSGNAAVEKSASFSLDTVAPNVAVTSHTNGQTVNAAAINLAGTTSDATSGVASVEVNGTAATIANGNWTLNNFALSEGANVISVVAEDKAGHSKTVILSITYTIPDTQKPLINISAPAANEMDGAKPVLVSADLSDNKAVDPASVVVKLDGIAVTSQCAVTAVSVSCSLNPTDGAHALTVDCKDTSSNSAVQKSVSFTLDTVAPSVTVTSHTNGQTVNTAAINLAGTVSDATSGVASVEVNGTAATIANGNWALNNFALSEGANVISVVAEDRAGHTTTNILTVTYVRIVCRADADCNDSDALTIDKCSNPGTGSSKCTNTPIACNTNADCTGDAKFCIGGGTTGAVCSICRNNSDCDDHDAHTADVCSNAGTASASCVHNSIECLNDTECNDQNPLTLDKCNSAGTSSASCSHDPLKCAADGDCNDGDALTLDKCNNPRTLQSSCAHTTIECNNNRASGF
jgi:hypothetical protein